VVVVVVVVVEHQQGVVEPRQYHSQGVLVRVQAIPKPRRHCQSYYNTTTSINQPTTPTILTTTTTL
jgi:deferrochelatase/peroxidase EfeB